MKLAELTRYISWGETNHGRKAKDIENTPHVNEIPTVVPWPFFMEHIQNFLYAENIF